MNHIPISFDYKGKHYNATLEEVIGAGDQTWHLMIDKYYNGKLIFYPKDQRWYFRSQTGEFEELSDFFGEYLILWYG